MHYENSIYHPFGEIGLIVLESSRELGEKIDKKIVSYRKELVETGVSNEVVPDSYIIPITEVRFSNGEGKIRIGETIRGKDVYILCDVGNYNCTYDMYGYKNRKGPDEHFQDIKRVLSAISGKSRRTTVVMPLLYAARQHKRKSRESLDCAMALQELERMGVKVIICFDAHDPNIQNAIPLTTFENLYPSYDIVTSFLAEENVSIRKDQMLIVAPDTGAMDRAIYYSGVMELDVGLCYKRRDYTTVVNGRNPILSHEYMGSSVEGIDVLVVDDMIASGESIFDIVLELKKRKAKDIYVATTFALFTEGTAKFEEFYEKGLLKRVYSTNLSYVPKEVVERPWFKEVDLSGFLSRIIDNLSYDKSIHPLLDATAETKLFVQQYK